MPAQRDSCDELPCSWMTHRTCQAFAGLFAGDFFFLPEEGGYVIVAVFVHAGVEGDGGDAGVGCPLCDGSQSVGVRHGQGDAVYLGVDGRLDQVCLVGGLGIVGVAEFQVVFFGGVFGAFTDQVPEGVPGGPVGDHSYNIAGGLKTTVFGASAAGGRAGR